MTIIHISFEKLKDKKEESQAHLIKSINELRILRVEKKGSNYAINYIKYE